MAVESTMMPMTLSEIAETVGGGLVIPEGVAATPQTVATINTLFRDDRDALLVPFDRIESVGIDKESQLAGKADGTHHAQRIVAKRNIRIERRTDQ